MTENRAIGSCRTFASPAERKLLILKELLQEVMNHLEAGVKVGWSLSPRAHYITEVRNNLLQINLLSYSW